MTEQAYQVCGIAGCGKKHYVETDLYYDGSDNLLDRSDIQTSCSIAGAITKRGCLMYTRAYDNSPANRPNSDQGDQGDFWTLID